MSTELVNSATSEKLDEMDWTKNIEICEVVARDPRLARDVVKAIKKRLTSKHPNAQLYAVLLLEMLMSNIGENVHKRVIETGVLPILLKIVKRKSDSQVRERIFLLLDATQTSVGGACGKFPQYYTAYFELVNAGVHFPQRSSEDASRARAIAHTEEVAVPKNEIVAPQIKPQDVPESSIIQKATNALEVLREVLDAVDPRNPEAAKDEFTLDLVEQCSFQKQRVMHVVMSSRNKKLVSQAIELNEQLQRILTRHDALLSSRPTPVNRFTVLDRATSTTDHIVVPDRTSPAVTHINHEEAEEEEEEDEEPEQLFRRLRKGKACVRPEDEGNSGERFNRPLIRPLSSARRQEPSMQPPIVIPPPPAKHVERERFFQEKKVDGATVAGHMRGLSIHSHSGGSSRSRSLDFSS